MPRHNARGWEGLSHVRSYRQALMGEARRSISCTANSYCDLCLFTYK